MERKRFKEYSEAAIVEKEELYAMKSCFEELHIFINGGGGGGYSFGSQNKRSVKEFLSSRGTLR